MRGRRLCRKTGSPVRVLSRYSGFSSLMPVLLMSPYDRFVLPYLIDFACGIRPVQRQRAKLVPQARGKVLEIGMGTGLNLPHYDRQRLVELWGLDPALQMHRLAEKRMRSAGLKVKLLGLPAEEIPVAANSFDTLVCTYTLCTIEDPARALKEMRRVIRPGGRLLFCEHGLAPDAKVQRWQARLNPLWRRLAGGCQLDRDVPALLQQAGWQLDELKTLYLPGPRPLTYNYWGQAHA